MGHGISAIYLLCAATFQPPLTDANAANHLWHGTAKHLIHFIGWIICYGPRN